jgi:hypothetical protein
MTIGPAPMIRIEEMSVRLGIGSNRRAQKKGALCRASLCPRRKGLEPRARLL